MKGTFWLFHYLLNARNYENMGVLEQLCSIVYARVHIHVCVTYLPYHAFFLDVRRVVSRETLSFARCFYMYTYVSF